jgi:hypothetical protein
MVASTLLPMAGKGVHAVRMSFLLATVALLTVLVVHARGQSSPPPVPHASAPADHSKILPRGNVEHGRYIAEHVAMCIECHSGRDADGNILQDALFTGGSIPFAPPWPNDWANRAPRNKGLPGYTDEQALRLLTEGAIGRDGTQLRPPMPRFRMTAQDAADVIAFLRSLP